MIAVDGEMAAGVCLLDKLHLLFARWEEGRKGEGGALQRNSCEGGGGWWDLIPLMDGWSASSAAPDILYSTIYLSAITTSSHRASPSPSLSRPTHSSLLSLDFATNEISLDSSERSSRSLLEDLTTGRWQLWTKTANTQLPRLHAQRFSF